MAQLVEHLTCTQGVGDSNSPGSIKYFIKIFKIKMYQNFLIISESFSINMFFPLKISDWDMDQYKLILQLFSIVLIVVLLVYIALSSRDNE